MEKIDSYYEINRKCILTTMKPIYGINEQLNCGTISYGDKNYLIDYKDKDRIINFNKSFVFNDNDKEDYPAYTYNNKRFTYIDFIFNFNSEKVCYHFINNNKFDLRHCNVEIYHFYHKYIIENYTFVEYIKGHYSLMGKDAYVMKNPLWKIIENGKEYLLMYCEKDTICKLCKTSYEKILDFELSHNNGQKITFGKGVNGYILSHFKDSGLSIHQIITGCYGNGKGTKNISVDHIDQNPLNNTWDNLRIATREVQEQNSKGIKDGTKRERKKNAKDLPEGITQQMMKKYVVYYHEWLDKEHTKEREFFKIEKHPKLDKHWMTSKSSKVSIFDKLKQANKVIDDLENNIYPNKEDDEVKLPKYVSLVLNRDKLHLVYEKRVNGNRLGLKMVLPLDHDLQEQIIILNEKIGLKYTGESII